MIQDLLLTPAMTGEGGVVRAVGFCVCCCEAVEIFVGFVCTVELTLIDSLRLQAWSVPLFVLCCSAGMQQFCLCGVPATLVGMGQRQIRSHRSSGHGISVFSLF